MPIRSSALRAAPSTVRRAFHRARRSIWRTACRTSLLLTLVVALAACATNFASTASSELDSSETVTRLTASAYQDILRRACIAADEKIQQISELHPEGTPIDSVLEVDRVVFAQIESAAPPDEFKTPHANIVTLYKQRLSSLEVLSGEIHAANNDTAALQTLMDDADNIGYQMNEFFGVVGVDECQF